MIVVEQIESRHLAGNVIGDPSRRDLVIYLPPSYGHSERRYRSAYLLHGFGGKAIHWATASINDGVHYRSVDDLADEAIAAGASDELIIVMPDGWSRWGCSQWVDSPVNGHFERYVIDEVVPYVDSTYRTIQHAASRGVFGISSGGLGAWHLGSRHPDVFGALSMLSADSFFEHTHRSWILQYYNHIFPKAPDGPVAGDAHSWVTYGLAACYSPNVAKPPYYVDLPLEFPSGAPIAPLWERWLSYDPVVSWESRQENLRALRGILLDTGYRDQYDLHYGHRLLARSLSSAGIAHQVEEHEGTHTSLLNQRIQFSLGWFSQMLERDGESGRL